MAQAKKVTGDKVRYAVVGVGWIAQAAFLPGVEHTGNSEVVALVTGHEEKAAKVGDQYRIERVYAYNELDDLLGSGEIDAVYLATPNFDHVEYAVRILTAGVHLLVEKPMAAGVEECERMMRAAESSGAKLMVAYRLHFEPGTLKAIERVRGGEIGTARFFNSSFSQQVSGQNHRAKHGFWAGPGPDLGPYSLNMVRNLFGSEPLEVFATGVCTDPERFVDQNGNPFEDTVAVTLKFDANRVAAFVLSYSGGDIDEFRIVGSKGDLYSNPAYQLATAMEHVLTVEQKTSRESFKQTDHFGGELKYFSECILQNKNPEPDGEEGMLDVRVIAAMERSLRTGEVQRLEPVIRRRRIDIDQVQKLGAVEPGELVGAHKPSEGR